jgi:hypothetical protein
LKAGEEWRFECETRYVLTLRRISRDRAAAYIGKVGDKRGAEAAKALREAAAALWKAEQQRREDK